MSITPSTPHGCVTHGLLEAGWYWDNADRQTVFKALIDQPDGSFIVRNASTPGDFTLSVRFKGEVKLLKIVVNDNKCGFNLDALTHDSVVQLIEFHHKIPLSVFNNALNIALMYPVSTRRNSQSGRPAYKKGHLQQRTIVSAKNDQDWRERMELEKLRAYSLTVERAARLLDSVKEQKARAEGHCHTLTQAIRDNGKKVEALENLQDEQRTVVVEIEDSRSASDMFKKVFSNNQKCVTECINRIKSEVDKAKIELKSASKHVEDYSEKYAEAKARVDKLTDIRNNIYEKMEPSLANRAMYVIESSAEMLTGEQPQVTEMLLELELKWNPEQWLMCGTSKENAANALVHARYRIAQYDRKIGVAREPIDGVFLVRGSSSHADKLVLSVLHGERVSHCLIEQNEFGWGFEHSNVYLTTIADFVRYYTHNSLETHADAIKTSLKMPAFEVIPEDRNVVLRNGPGQLFYNLPISRAYMMKAMLTDDPMAPPKEPFSWMDKDSPSPRFGTLEKPDSLSLRTMTVRDSIPE